MILFDDNITRIKALSCKKNIDKNTKIYVHRNHSFEMTGNVINAFLNFSDIEADFIYSSYDDSLTFTNDMEHVDLHILWLDLERYDKNRVADFVQEKTAELRTLTKSPVLLALLGLKNNDIKINTTDVYTVSIDDIVAPLGEKAFDLEKEPVSGTRLSAKASVKIAQYLGLKIIPSVLKPSLKAIVVDLDNTLYKGIIGEDGIENVDANNKLQKKLIEFKEQGFLLCIASKNEEQDAKALFEKRKDFVLKWQDFTSVRINWNSKAGNIEEIARDLNIGVDAMLFIDDNIAEIESVKTSIPDIKTILATSEDDVLRYLNLYPGLMKKSISKEDALRSDDLKANKERAELSKKLSKEEYFKKLEMKIELTLNDRENINRITELLNKTNQFILSYRRYNISQVEELLNSKEACIVTAGMSDKLSDSGIIAILIARKDRVTAVVDELTFSCRALGRNIEDIVISKMLKMSADYLKTTGDIKIDYQKGPRNTPALNWLTNFVKEELKEKGTVNYTLPAEIKTFGLNIKEFCNVI